MNTTKILFFGSTTDSVIVLRALAALPTCTIAAVVTQPPRPVGRKQIVTPTPVETWAREHNITTLSFESNKGKAWLYADEEQVIDALEPIRADLIISASYGQKIPSKTLSDACFGGINVHPSILPRWRGGDPVPWAIMTGDAQIGVTVLTLSKTFDAGLTLAQKKIPIQPTDTSGPLRTHLFQLGTELLSDLLPRFLAGIIKGKPQRSTNELRAKRLTRAMGFEPWENIINPKEAERMNRKFRALHPWPGMWSTVKEKRIKILGFDHTPTIVQFEGKKPITWEQFISVYE